jgi:hypothetical protein
LQEIGLLEYYKKCNNTVGINPAPANTVIVISMRPATPFFNSGFSVELAAPAPADEALWAAVTVTATPPAVAEEADAATVIAAEGPDTEI